MSAGLIDLHVHTTASDGTLTPAKTVFHAVRCGLAAVAITDHDTVDGVAEALAAGAEAGLEVVPGVEISVDYPGEMHILGYFLDPQNPELLAGLELLRKYREVRNPRLAAKLRQLGLDISLEEVAAVAAGEVIGRPHFAVVMQQKGYVSSYDEAFELYLGAGKPAYVKKERLMPREGIALITAAGGIPVLAHPKYLAAGGENSLEELVRELKGYGLKGIEVFYTTHTPGETGQYCRLAGRFGLVITGGTDFHGANKPEIAIGTGGGDLKVGYHLLEKLKELRRLKK